MTSQSDSSSSSEESHTSQSSALPSPPPEAQEQMPQPDPSSSSSASSNDNDDPPNEVKKKNRMNQSDESQTEEFFHEGFIPLTGWRLWFLQLGALLKKNWHLTIRDWSWLMLITPCLTSLILFAIVIAVERDLSNDPHPNSNPVQNFNTECDIMNADVLTECISIGLINPAPGDPIVGILASQNPNLVLREFMNQDEVTREIDDGLNVESVVLFEDLSGNVSYTLVADDDDFLSLLRTVDRAVITRNGGLGDYQLNLETRDLPFVFIDNGFPTDTFQILAPLFYFLVPTITSFVFLFKIAQEKEKKLRLGMKLMGLSDSAWWASWWITTIIYNALLSILIIISGYIFVFDFFILANPPVTFVLFFTFATAMTAMISFLFPTFTSTASQAVNLGWAILIIGFVLQGALFSNPIVLNLFFDDQEWVQLIRWLLQLFYPPFNFSLVFSAVAEGTSPQIDPDTNEVNSGARYNFGDLYEEGNSTGLDNTVPPAHEALLLMFWQIILYGGLALYTDQVIGGPNGPGRNYFYFLFPSYWGFHYGKDTNLTEKEIEKELEKWKDEDKDVFEEKRRALSADRFNPDIPIVAQALTRKYGKVKAVDSMSIQINQGDCFCLLGHNGAGKTTLINILNGLYQPSNGNASIYGYDLIRDIGKIRSLISVIPQHDILWEEMTPTEHLHLFAQFKGLRLTQEDINRQMKSVNLDHVVDAKSKTFSGGMKRRLSVAIAAVSNPKLIFADEPTTGLDPVSKRAVWNLVLQLRKKAVILLTTHILEEADFLSNRIGIMSFGKFRCLGSAFHLKNRYGEGYRLHILTQKPEQFIKFVEDTFPELTLSNQTKGNLTFQCDLQQIGRLADFTESLDEKINELQIEDWGIQHTSLEDVFLKVTEESNFGFANRKEARVDEPPSPREGKEPKEMTSSSSSSDSSDK